MKYETTFGKKLDKYIPNVSLYISRAIECAIKYAEDNGIIIDLSTIDNISDEQSYNSFMDNILEKIILKTNSDYNTVHGELFKRYEDSFK